MNEAININASNDEIVRRSCIYARRPKSILLISWHESLILPEQENGKPFRGNLHVGVAKFLLTKEGTTLKVNQLTRLILNAFQIRIGRESHAQYMANQNAAVPGTDKTTIRKKRA